MLTLASCAQPAVQQSFFQALIGILVLDVFPDQADRYFPRWLLDAMHHVGPGGEIPRTGIESQQAQRDFIHALVGERQRDFVDAVHVAWQ